MAQRAENLAVSPTKKQIDSLLKVLEVSIEGSRKVNTIFGLGANEKADNNDDPLLLASEVLKLANKENDIAAIGKVYLVTSKYFQKRKNYKNAFKNIFIALELSKSAQDQNAVANCYLQISKLHLILGHSSIATKYQDSALSVFHALGKAKEEADLYIVKGILASNLGENGSALESNYAALNIYEKLGDNSGVATALGALGFTYYASKEDSLAEKYLVQASNIFMKENDQFGYADNIMTMGDLKLDQGKYSEALKYYNEGFKIFQLPGATKTGIAWSYDCFARLEIALGDSANSSGNFELAKQHYKIALSNLSTSLEKFSNLNLVLPISQAKLYAAEVNYKLGRYAFARKNVMDALEGFKNSEGNEPLAKAYLYLSKLDSIEGNYANAYKNFQLYSFYNDKILNSSITKKVEIFKVQDKIRNKEKEIQLLESENALKTTQAEKQKQQKLFAYGGIVIVILMSAYGFLRFRQRKKTEMEQAQMKDRLQISQGLHDDIGSTLSSISVYSQVAQKLSEKNEREEMKEMLGKISLTSNEMVSEMSDIVWAINPKNDNMEKIIQRMESFARPLLATRNISFKLCYEPLILGINLPMEKRKNFYLIFKEAVNNSFKYSGCSEIVANIFNSHSHLKLNIVDNGVGFDVRHEMEGNKFTLSGNGLRNMNARAVEMKGGLILTSAPGEGTKLHLSFPIP